MAGKCYQQLSGAAGESHRVETPEATARTLLKPLRGHSWSHCAETPEATAWKLLKPPRGFLKPPRGHPEATDQYVHQLIPIRLSPVEPARLGERLHLFSSAAFSSAREEQRIARVYPSQPEPKLKEGRIVWYARHISSVVCNGKMLIVILNSMVAGVF